MSLGLFTDADDTDNKYELRLGTQRWGAVYVGNNDDDWIVPRSRNVPITITGIKNRPLAVSVVLRLKRTQATFDAWRNEVFRPYASLTSD